MAIDWQPVPIPDLSGMGDAGYRPAVAAAPSPAELERLRAIQAERDYWQNPAKQREVADGYARLYPGRTAGPNLGPRAR